MHLFADYVQPITIWLKSNPNWALLFTFLISFLESLAIIGNIIPGSVTMTAIGILAGSGVLRIDLTLFAAILGAIGGDSLSYFLGYIFKDRIRNMWPFRKNPSWLIYGQNYFEHHGGKSVIIGRFVGPLRPIIPMIAGMMRMSQLRFFTVNVISAIGWSIIYVMPGIFIGAASSELSPEIATRLFIVVLASLAGLWLISIALKWFIIMINDLLRRHLNDLWRWSLKHPHSFKLIKFLTPPLEKKHYQTAFLCLSLILTFIFFSVLSILVFYGIGQKQINEPIHLFFQSLKTVPFDRLFIWFNQFISNLSLVCVFIFIVITTLYRKDYRTLIYWLFIHATCIALLLLTHLLIQNPRPTNLLEVIDLYSFPAIHLTFATVQYLGIIYFINKYGNARFNQFLTIILLFILLMAGLSNIYLGDNWILDIVGAYLAGLGINLFYWLLYRRRKNPFIYHGYHSIFLMLVLLFSSIVSFALNFHQVLRSHQPYLTQYVITDQAWWDQQKPALPIFRTNRFGKKIDLFNIQYAGALNHFESALRKAGWRKENETFFKSFINRISGGHSYLDSPLIAPLYLNRKPVLIMINQATLAEPSIILRMWPSNYHIKHFREPIWIGSATIFSSPKFMTKSIAIDYVGASLPLFLQKRKHIQLVHPIFSPYPIEPVILLIKENPFLE